jgi:hypothetical protein
MISGEFYFIVPHFLFIWEIGFLIYKSHGTN